MARHWWGRTDSAANRPVGPPSRDCKCFWRNRPFRAMSAWSAFSPGTGSRTPTRPSVIIKPVQRRGHVTRIHPFAAPQTCSRSPQSFTWNNLAMSGTHQASWSTANRIGFDLNNHGGVDKAFDFDHAGGRRMVAKDLAMRLAEFLPARH